MRPTAHLVKLFSLFTAFCLLLSNFVPYTDAFAAGTVSIEVFNESNVDVVLKEDTAAGLDFRVNALDPAGAAVGVAVTAGDPSLLDIASPTGIVSMAYADFHTVLTPAALRNGTVTVTITATADGETVTKDLVLTVDEVNDVPVASAQSCSTTEDHPLTITLTATDEETDSTSLLFAVSESGLRGSLSQVSSGIYEYTPEANFNGTTSFSFTASDGVNTSEPATVTIDVGGENDAPTVQDVSKTVAVNTDQTPIRIDLNGTDADGDALTYAIKNDNGLTVTVEGNQAVLVPATGDLGPFTFTYVANDKKADSVPATVTVNITRANHSPTTSDFTVSATEDTPVDFSFSGRGGDADGDALTVRIESVPTGGVLSVSVGSVLLPGDSVTFTPDSNFNGNATFTYKILDDVSESKTNGTVTIHVAAVNDAPTATAATVTTLEDTARDITLSAADVDAGDTLTYRIDTAPPAYEGTVNIPNANIGSATFTPAAGWNGTTSFTFVARDGTVDSAPVTITVIVSSVDDAPVAHDDFVSDVYEDTTATITSLVNDTDEDVGDYLTLVLDSSPSNGTVDVYSGTYFVYTPNANFNGIDSFTYYVKDSSNRASGTATVHLTVQPVNDAPVAIPDSITTAEDTGVTISPLENDTDIEDATSTSFTIASVTNPANGTATISSDRKTILYTPKDNYNGEDTFYYTMADSVGEPSAAVLITVTVTSVNDDPVAVSDKFFMTEDVARELDVLANDDDPDLHDASTTENLTVTVESVLTKGTATVTALGTILYTPNENVSGQETFTYQIKDSGGKTSTAQVTVTIAAVNDAPTFGGLADTYTVDEDNQITISFTIGDAETERSAMLLQAASGNETLLPAANITYGAVADSSQPQRSIILKPATNKNGAMDVTLSLSDGLLVTTKTIHLTVNSVNDKPVATTDTRNYTEDVPLDIDMADLIDNDNDNADSGTVSFVQSLNDISLGTLTLKSGTVYTYTPAPNKFNTATFHYLVQDGEGATATGLVQLVGTAVNDAPTIELEDGFSTSMNEDSATPTSIHFTFNDVEASPSSLILMASCTKQELIVDAGLRITRDTNGNGTLEITPNADQNGTANIVLTVSDGTITVSRSFAFTINPVEDIPVAVNDLFSMSEDSVRVFDPLNNDYDRDNDRLSIVAIDGQRIATYSSITVADGDRDAEFTRNFDGTITYEPTIGLRGSKTYTYTISDGDDEQTASITIDISAVEDAPVLDPIAALTMDEDGTRTVTLKVTDIDLDKTHHYAVTSDNTALLSDASLVPAGDTMTIHPTANASGEAIITVKAIDGTGRYDTKSFRVTVLPVNDAPQLVAHSYTTDEDQNTSFNLLDGAFDVESDHMSVVSVGSPSKGTLSISGSNYVYAPYPNEYGSDSFTYSVTDGSCVVSTTTSITINEVNDRPYAYSIYTTDKGQADGTTLIIDPTGYYNDVDLIDKGNLTISTDDPGATVLGDQTIQYTLPEATGSYTSFTYTVTDTRSATATALVYIARSGEGPFAPIVFGFDSDLNEDNLAKTYDISLYDADKQAGETYTFAVASAASLGSVTFDNEHHKLIYTPNPNANGTDRFTFYATSDLDSLESNRATVEIRIRPINDPPALTAVGDVSMTEDGPDYATITTLSDPDVGDHPTLTVFSDKEDLLPRSAISIVDKGSGQMEITLNPLDNAYGDTVITLVASDGMAETRRQFNVHVGAVNDAPVATACSLTTNEEVAFDIDVATEDADVDNPASELSIVLVSTPSTLEATARVITKDGRQFIRFEPVYNFAGNVAGLSYKLVDKDGAESASASIAVNVINSNDAPVISGINYVQTTQEDTPLSIDFTVTDADKDTLSVTAVASNSSLLQGCTVTSLGGNQYRLELTPTANKFGTTMVRVLAAEQAGSDPITTTYEFELTILAVNDTPEAKDIDAATNEDTAVTVQVLDQTDPSDTEDDKADLHIVSVGTPSHGTAVNNGNGTITYTPSSNYNGDDHFTFTIADTGNETQTKQVNVSVASVNDAPSVRNHVFTITEDTELTGQNVLTGASDVEGDSLSVPLYDYHNIEDRATVTMDTAGNMSFTPNKNVTGSLQFSYTVNDGQPVNGTTTGLVTVNITPVNDAPELTPTVATPFSFNEDAAYADFGINIFDPETPTNNLIVKAWSSDWSKVRDDDIEFIRSGVSCTVRMKSQPDKYGSFYLYVSAGDGQYTTEERYEVNILPINDAPTMSNITATVEEDKTKSGSATATDLETPERLSFSLKSGPSHGSATVSSLGGWQYTPAANYNGTDVFTIEVSDNDNIQPNPLTTTATVTVTVTAANDPPTAADDAVTVAEHGSVEIRVLDNDVDLDGDALHFVSFTSPTFSHGFIQASGTSLIYTPNHGWDGSNVQDANYHHTGTETFQYTVTDGKATATASVTVTVTPVNDPPYAGTDTKTIDEDSDAVTIDVLANDADVDDDHSDLIISQIASASSFGTVTIAGDQKSLTYKPDANKNGADAFTYLVTDGEATATGLVRVTVNPINDLPTITIATGTSITTDEDVKTEAIPIVIHDIEDASNLLTISIAASNSSLVDNSRLQYTYLSGDDATIAVTPKANQNGTTNVTVTVTDRNGGMATTQFTLNVTAVNDAPNPTVTTLTTNEDTYKEVNLLPTGIDPDNSSAALTLTLDTLPTHGTLATTGTHGYVRYTPAADYNGPDSFIYSVSDGELTTQKTVTVTVSPVNDAPVIQAIATQNTDEDTATGEIAIVISDIDSDINAATLTLGASVTSLADGTASCTSFGGSGGSRTLVLTPKLNQNGQTNVTVTVNDRSGTATATASTQFLFKVNAVNDAPVAQDDAIAINEDTVATLNVLGNDSDADIATNADSLHIVAIATPSGMHGSVVISGDHKSITYTHEANYYGAEPTFTYTVSDSNGSEKTANVALTIQSVNDLPTITATVTGLTLHSEENGQTESFAINVGDVETDVASLTVTGKASNSSLVPDSGIVVTGTGATRTVYVQPALHQNGITKVTLTVTDGNLAIASLSFTVDVNSENDSPVAVNDTYATLQEDTAADLNVLANDNDVDITTNGDALTVVSIATPSGMHGSLTIVSNKIHYVPESNWYGSEPTFTYTIHDKENASATAQVSITVHPVNDAPVLNDVSVSVAEDATKTGTAAATDVETPGLMTYTLKTAPSHGSATVTSMGAWEYTPAANYHGADSFVIQVNDNDDTQGVPKTDTGTVNITVTSVNNPPTPQDDLNVTVPEDGSIRFDALANDTDVDKLLDAGETITLDSVETPAHGTAINDGGWIKYTPAADYNGSDSFTYTVRDRAGATGSATVYVSVTPQTDAPSISGIAGTINTPEDTATNALSFTISDADGLAALTVVGASSNTSLIDSSGITLGGSLGSRTVRLTPKADQFGTTNVTLTVTDGDGLSNSMTFAFNVTPVNDAPVIHGLPATITILEDGTSGDIAFTVSDVDDDASTLTVTKSITDSDLFTLAGVQLDGSGQNRTVSLTPKHNANGTDTLTITVTDDESASATAQAAVTVTPVNDVPVVSDDSVTIDEDTTTLIDALANDTDADTGDKTNADALHIVSLSPAQHGTATIESGKIRYTPATNWFSTATSLEQFDCVVSDKNGATQTSLVRVTVNSVNDLPVIAGDKSAYSLSINQKTTARTFTISDVEDAADQLTFALSSGNTALLDASGITITGTGGSRTLTFEPKSGANGYARISMTVTDTDGGTSTVALDLTVNAPSSGGTYVFPTPIPSVAATAAPTGARTNAPTAKPSDFTVIPAPSDVPETTAMPGPSLPPAQSPAQSSAPVSSQSPAKTAPPLSSQVPISSAPPVILHVQNPGDSSPTTQGTVTVEDVLGILSESDVESYCWTQSESPDNWISAEQPPQGSELSDVEGIWHLYVKKNGKVLAKTYIVDHTPPTIDTRKRCYLLFAYARLQVSDSLSGVDRVVDENGKPVRLSRLYWQNGTFRIVAFDKAGNKAEYSLVISCVRRWLALGILLGLFFLWFLLFYKRKIYYTEDKPGEGVYYCLKCKEEQYIFNDEQELPVCPNCEKERFRRRRFKKVR